MYFANEPDSPADHLNQLDDANDLDDLNDSKDHANHDSNQPNAAQANTAQPDAAQPDMAQPDTTQPADTQPSTISADAADHTEQIPSASDAKKAGKDLTYLDILGKNIRRIRKSKQLTLQQAAQKCNIRWQQLQVVESGKTNFSVQLLFSIVQGLGINNITEIWPVVQILTTNHPQAPEAPIEQKSASLQAIRHEGERQAVAQELSIGADTDPKNQQSSVSSTPVNQNAVQNTAQNAVQNTAQNTVNQQDTKQLMGNEKEKKEIVENLLETVDVESKNVQQNKKIATYVAKMRIERDWTQQKLADKSGMSLSTIRHIEHNRKNPRMDSLQKIANAFGVDVRELLPPSPHE